MSRDRMTSDCRKLITPVTLMSFAASCVLAATVEPTTSDVHSDEVCQMETFHAACEPDRVILVESAQLGRLKIGRCVKQVSAQQGYPIGCTLDVMPEMESFCSGRRQCDVKIDDVAFPRQTPCHRALKVHLWVEYRCIKVVTPDTTCSRSGSSYVVSGRTSGFLASQTTEDTGCGLTETPWIIQVGTGQRINVTMYDYSYRAAVLQRADLPSRGSYPLPPPPPPTQARTCRVFATIREPSRGITTTTVCDMRGRIVNVFTSDADLIELRIMTVTRHTSPRGSSASRTATDETVEPDNYVMFHYTVIGCAEPPIASDGRTWKRRAVDTMTVGCTGSDVTWKLTCVGNQWHGSYSNCTAENAPVIGSSTEYPLAMSSIVVIIIAVFVSSVILLIGISCIKWRIKNDATGRRLRQSELDQYDPSAVYGLAAVDKTSHDVSYAVEGGGGPIVPDSAGIRNEYARMRLQHLVGAGQPYSDGLPYGLACRGERLPPPLMVEHIYESPDVVRRDAFPDEQYTPTTRQQHQQSSPHHGYWPMPSPGVSTPVSVKAKNTGNYSL